MYTHIDISHTKSKAQQSKCTWLPTEALVPQVHCRVQLDAVGPPFCFKPEMPKCPTTGQAKGLLSLPLPKRKPQISSWHCGYSTRGERAIWKKRDWERWSLPPVPASAPGPSWVGCEEGVEQRKGDNFWGSRYFFRSFLSSTSGASHSLAQPTSHLSSALLFLHWFPFGFQCSPVFPSSVIGSLLCPTWMFHLYPGLQLPSTRWWLSGLFFHLDSL